MEKWKEDRITLLGLLLLLCIQPDEGRALNESSSAVQSEFWKRSIIYQIYPRSFRDSNEDGIGDLAGIASKADYFKDLGVETIWLSPIYKSPMADFGYDVSDFRDIDQIFGTMEDFDKLLEEMHARDIKVLLDFVPNHSSDEHEWFQKSVQNDPQYKDYYIWKDPIGFNESGDPIPPNNWLSSFRFSAWEWSDERKQFYFHQYLKKQPDLNFRNPKVMQEMEDIMRFWLDKGVDGFRVDAIMRLFEVEEVYGMDEPVDTDSGISDPTQYKYLKHIYTTNQPETFVALNQWMQLINEYDDKLLMLQVSERDVDQVMMYYGNDSFPVSHFPFNFLLLWNLRDRPSLTGSRLKDVVELWLGTMPEGRWPNWVLGSHDNSRVATRVGADLVDALNMFTLLLPGTPVTYYGEEIGMEDAFISFEDTQDPSGCNNGPDRYQETSRDPERTPMQWDGSRFAGFTEGNSTWLTVNENYVSLNVESELEDVQSHLKVYKQLAELRRKDAFRYGDIEFQLAKDDAVAFMRNFQDEKFVVVINTSEEESHIDLTDGQLEFPETGTVVIRSSSDSRPETAIGSAQNLSSVVLLPGQGMVLDVHE